MCMAPLGTRLLHAAIGHRFFEGNGFSRETYSRACCRKVVHRVASGRQEELGVRERCSLVGKAVLPGSLPQEETTRRGQGCSRPEFPG